jgi:DNA ligase 1
MRDFANLFLALDRTNKTNEKLVAIKNYFEKADEKDKIWALALFTGRRPSFKINSALIRQCAKEESGIPEWLFAEGYNAVGDLGETISLILPEYTVEQNPNLLSYWFDLLLSNKTKTDEEKKAFIKSCWKKLTRYEIFVFNKVMMGSFRIGVSQTLIVRALADLANVEPGMISHKLMGNWDPQSISFSELTGDSTMTDFSRPYPYYLAYPIENGPESLGNVNEWTAEWKWDGIRSQIIKRNDELFIWTRGEELATDKFPELHFLRDTLDNGTVLDGEIVSYSDGRPLPFNLLQTRIGRKNITRKVMSEAPVAFIVYDILEFNHNDVRTLPQSERRQLLEKIHTDKKDNLYFHISPLLNFSDWNELKELHGQSRLNAAEGFMIKRKSATYQTGRKKGDWWKWKIDPLSVDAVLVYAQKGHGRRAELYTDYTFAVWADDKLVPFAKAYSGLTDEEINKVDRFIKQNTLEKFGPVRTVKAELVFEIGFEGINTSARHKSGIAVRFPRILRWRKDKPASEADTLENLQTLLKQVELI